MDSQPMAVKHPAVVRGRVTGYMYGSSALTDP